MPRFLVETEPQAAPTSDTADLIWTQRFPEVVLEHRYAAYDETTSREVWLCRAPSGAHVHRWAVAIALRLVALQHVADVPGEPPKEQQPATRSDGPDQSAAKGSS
jgi:hypothetical protein